MMEQLGMATEERNLNNEAKSISKVGRHHCDETKNDNKEFEQDLNLDSLFKFEFGQSI